ncbi:MAG: AMP-binding protein [Desulfobulbaceae bacterium]|nr:AMP-binding protein [Desulfobulbaceae bacterium]
MGEQVRKSYFRRDGEIPLLEKTIPAHLAEVAARFPDREAVVARPQGRRLTYRQLLAAVDRLAAGFVGMGFSAGERVGIWSTNNLEWLLLQLATARIGVILVNINPACQARELAYALKRSEVQGLFLTPGFRDSDYAAILLELLPELRQGAGELASPEFPALRRVVFYDPGRPQQTRPPAPGFFLWNDVLVAGAAIDTAALDRLTNRLTPNDPINIQYTSGTTGFPKAVLLSHRNILNNAYFSALTMHFSEQDRLCVPVPFYHCFGMVLANLLCLSVGATIVIACEYFQPLAVLAAIAEERCTAVHGVPTMFIAELEEPRFREFDLRSLRTGIMAGAPCPPALMTRVMEEMHCREILIGYGETEASPLTHLTAPEDSLQRRTETVGHNLPHQEVKVVSLANGETVPLGEVGEICFRGYHVMRGYYGDPEATAKAIDPEGWLHSGDLGTMDGEGYVAITGRLKNMIIRGGENIYPREIEDFLFTHPKVASVAVIGVPDDYYGEAVMAWVKLHEGMTASEAELREFCAGRIARFKSPKYIWFVDEFPMTVTGKIQKFKMREEAMARLAAARES